MPFAEQHVGHPVVARIDLAAVYPPDLTVEGMDGLTALDVRRTQRNNVLGNGLHRRCDTRRPVQVADNVVHQLHFLGRLEAAELLHGAAQPYAVGRAVDQVEGDEPACPYPVLRLDDQMRHRFGRRIDDQTAHLTAWAVHATNLGPHHERSLFGHSCLPPTTIVGIPLANRKPCSGTFATAPRAVRRWPARRIQLRPSTGAGITASPLASARTAIKTERAASLPRLSSPRYLL